MSFARQRPWKEIHINNEKTVNLFTLVLILLIVEMALIIISLLAVVIYYFLKKHQEKTHRLAQEKLNTLVMEILLGKRTFDPKLFSSFNLDDLLIVMELFDGRFSDEKWLTLKQAILNPTLMKQARHLTASANWVKRNKGIRLISLQPSHQDEEMIIRLIDDPVPLVRIAAAACGVRLGTKEIVKKILERIAKESELGSYPYRDALIQGKQAIYQIIERIFQEETNEAVKSVCLDILSMRVNEKLYPLLNGYLHSENAKDKAIAVKILSDCPNKDSLPLLLKFLQDEQWQVRAQAAKGLGLLFARSSISELSKALQDPIWQVRLEAALALKQIEEGYVILSRQDPDINLNAYQAAQYVLALPK